jgi:hypothetical protein
MVYHTGGFGGGRLPPAREDLALSDRVFVRPGCGRAADRDHNASLNILRRSGWEQSLEPVELRPLPAVGGQVGNEAGSPAMRAGVVHGTARLLRKGFIIADTR